jgi:hypothetical protein
MNQGTYDFTVGDALRTGFENGVIYMLRCSGGVVDYELTDDDISQLVQHLAIHKPWKTEEEWRELIEQTLARWA